MLALLGSGERHGLPRPGARSRTRPRSGAGTLYPLRARLRRRSSSKRRGESPTRAPARYYRLTTEGTAELIASTGKWRQFQIAVDALLEEEQ